MNILSIYDLQLSYGIKIIFDKINLGIAENERIALVGQNGVGKTTLLNLVSGIVKPDDGEIVVNGETTIAYLPQSLLYEEGETTYELLLRALTARIDAIKAHQEISQKLSQLSPTTERYEKLLSKQTELQHTIEHLGGWDYQHEIDEMVARLSLTELLDQPIDALSGGQKRRADLARALLSNATLLLLDEPTNHLDTETVEWLESWLLKRSKAILFVTHDRYFLERIATRIIEISGNGEIYDHPGNYSAYMERKVERIGIQKKTEERRQNLLRRELAWLRQGIKARGTRSKHRLASYYQLKEEAGYQEEKQLDITIAEGKSLGATILEGFNLTKTLGDQMILDNANFVVGKHDRIGIIGPNGCGKTSLIRILMEELSLDGGMVKHGARTNIAWLKQELPALDPSKSVYDAFSDSDYVWIGKEKYHKSQYLKNFLFEQTLQRASTSTLSGGQRRRFELAKLVAKNANVIILDEPTNDLDLTSLQALEEALENYSGCIVAISHDRYFLNRICNRIVAFENKTLETYVGNYDDYREKLAELQASIEEVATDPLNNTVEAPIKSNQDTQRKLTYAERLRIPKLEEEMQAIELDIANIETELADPTLYTERPQKIESLNRELITKNEALEQLFEEWSELESIREITE